MQWEYVFPSREKVFRVIADIIMVNASLFLALVAEIVYRSYVNGGQPFIASRESVNYYFQAFLRTTAILSPFSIIIYYLSGFYTYGRMYKGRYKALAVFQGVCFSYLIFGFISYFMIGMLHLSRSAFVFAWFFNTILLIVARLWAKQWGRVMRLERYLQRAPVEDKIENVLVIGGAGYIGSALIPRLLGRGYRVRILDLLLFGSDPIKEVLGHPRLEVVRADFRHVDKVVEAVREIDAVVHLGAIVGDPACSLDEDLTIEVNLMATRMIAEVAKGSQVRRFLFASTCSVYGASDTLLDEHSPLNPVSLYARSKIASEEVLGRMASPNFATTYLRFGTIYGLSGRPRFDLVVNLLAAKALTEAKITIYGGNQWRPFLHVDDAARAILRALEAPMEVINNEAFNVGSDEQNYKIEEVGRIIHRLIPGAEVVQMGSGSDHRNYRVDFSKIRSSLGFEPKWALEEGVTQVIEALKNRAITDYQDPRYSNAKFLSEQGTQNVIPHREGWASQLINRMK